MATKRQIMQSGVPGMASGVDLLNRHELNKGTAFTEEERSKFCLNGLLPSHVESIEDCR